MQYANSLAPFPLGSEPVRPPGSIESSIAKSRSSPPFGSSDSAEALDHSPPASFDKLNAKSAAPLHHTERSRAEADARQVEREDGRDHLVPDVRKKRREHDADHTAGYPARKPLHVRVRSRSTIH